MHCGFLFLYINVIIKIMKIIHFRKKYRENGFTLLELLVVLFIISLLSVLILVSYQNNKRKYILIQANQKLISDIRKIQNMAISGTEIEGYCSSTFDCFGYGIYFNSDSSYIFFADDDNNQTYNSGEGFETVDLPFPIIIVSPAQTSIVFKPPEPITYIDQDSGVNVSIDIILRIPGSASSKTINVSTAGLIKNN